MPSELVRKCLDAKEQGADFPTVWHRVLKGHPLVTGLPVQSIINDRPHLEIPLIGGLRLFHDTEANHYGLWPTGSRS